MRFLNLLLLSSLFFSSVLMASDEPLSQAHTLFREQQYQQALMKYLDAYQQTPLKSTRYNIAVCYFKLGQWQLALEHFLALQAISDPGGLIDYNIAVLYKKLGDNQRAAGLFQQLVSVGDETYRQLAEKQLSRMNISPTVQRKVHKAPHSSSRWQGVVSLGYGYDMDILSVSDEANIGKGDGFGEVMGALSWLSPARPQHHWRVDLLCFATKYQTESAYDITLLNGSASKYFPISGSKRDTVAVAAGYEKLLLGSDPYTSALVGSVEFRARMGKHASLSAEFTHKQIAEDDESYVYLKGSSDRFDLSWRNFKHEGDAKLGLRIIADRRQDRETDTSFTSYSANRFMMLGRKGWRFDDWRVALAVDYRYSLYLEPNVADSEDLGQRNDTRTSAIASLSYEFLPSLMATLEASWARNLSSIESYAYSQRQFRTNIEYQF